MGTSSSNGGQKPNTPLLPSWADSGPMPEGNPPLPPQALPQEPPQVLPQAPSQDLPQPAPQETSQPPREPLKIPPDRFRNARSNFSRYVSSGGTDKRSLGRALGHYVRTSSGGTKTAARRMWASRIATVNLINVLNDFHSLGIESTLSKISFPSLAGKPPKEILLALTDVICRPESSLDPSIARESFVETIVYLPDVDLTNLTEEQIKVITIQFISRTIVTRIINDIGHKIDANITAEKAHFLMKSLNDFVYGAIKDRLTALLVISSEVSRQDLAVSISNIYEVAYSLIEGEAGVYE